MNKNEVFEIAVHFSTLLNISVCWWLNKSPNSDLMQLQIKIAQSEW